MGKYSFWLLILFRTNSKSALSKDLVEGLEKDLEKLKRMQENILLRKTIAVKGSIDE
jgi:hypothetical protein